MRGYTQNTEHDQNSDLGMNKIMIYEYIGGSLYECSDSFSFKFSQKSFSVEFFLGKFVF